MADQKRIYISGPMAGLTTDEIEKAFGDAERELTEAGHIAVNPAVISAIPLEYDQYMQIDLQLVRFCDGIKLLPGWEKSKGAKTELAEALKRGIEVMV